MKKKIVAGLLIMAMSFSAVACGKASNDVTPETETTEQESSAPTKVDGVSSIQMGVDAKSNVASLCEYTGIDLTIQGKYTITDEDIDNTLSSLLTNLGIGTKEVTDRTVIEAGDYVNIDYTGYQDGEAFQGGTATDVLLDVSNNMDVTAGNTYIPGFCDDLIGAEVGTTVESEVTFPEEYGVESLNGQTVVFKFKVNGIYKPVTKDELTDEAVKEACEETYGFTTAKDLIDYVSSYLSYSAEDAKYNDTVEAAKTYVLSNSEASVPEDYLAARLSEYEVSYADHYCSEGQSLEDYLASNYGIDLATAEVSWKSYLQDQIKVEFLFTVIADKEGIEVDEDEFTTYVNGFLANTNFSFKEEKEVYEYFGAGNEEDGKKYLRQLYLVNKAIDLVVTSANVTENAAE